MVEKKKKKPSRQASRKESLELATHRARRKGLKEPTIRAGVINPEEEVRKEVAEVVPEAKPEAEAPQETGVEQEDERSFFRKLGDFINDPEQQAKIREARESGAFEEERQKLGERKLLSGENIGNTLTAAGLAFGPFLGGVGKAKTDVDVANKAKGIIQRADVDKLGKTLKLSQDQIAGVAKEIGRQRVQRIASAVLDNPTFLKTGRVALNAKTLGIKKSYLMKMAAATSNPYTILGLLGSGLYTSLFWAPNEKGDALLTLSIAQGQAAKIGDVELVNEIDILMQETQDIAAGLPIIGFMKAEIAKFKAAAIASETYKRTAEKTQEKQAEAEQPESRMAEPKTLSQIDERR